MIVIRGFVIRGIGGSRVHLYCDLGRELLVILGGAI